MMVAPTARRDDLAKIHIARKDLCMDEDSYRAMLWAIGRVKSSADLDFAGRQRVLDHLKACGWKPRASTKKVSPDTRGAWDWVNNAAEDRKPLLRKIAVMLRAADRGKEYADGMAKRMHSVDLVEFCRPDQLHAIVSALEFDKRRHAAKATT